MNSASTSRAEPTPEIRAITLASRPIRLPRVTALSQLKVLGTPVQVLAGLGVRPLEKHGKNRWNPKGRGSPDQRRRGFQRRKSGLRCDSEVRMAPVILFENTENSAPEKGYHGFARGMMAE